MNYPIQWQTHLKASQMAFELNWPLIAVGHSIKVAHFHIWISDSNTFVVLCVLQVKQNWSNETCACQHMYSTCASAKILIEFKRFHFHNWNFCKRHARLLLVVSQLNIWSSWQLLIPIRITLGVCECVCVCWWNGK